MTRLILVSFSQGIYNISVFKIQSKSVLKVSFKDLYDMLYMIL